MAATRLKIRDINVQFIKKKVYEWLDDHLLALLAAGFSLLVTTLMLLVDHFFPGYGALVALVALAVGAGVISRFLGC
jgi:hypothetical protein